MEEEVLEIVGIINPFDYNQNILVTNGKDILESIRSNIDDYAQDLEKICAEKELNRIFLVRDVSTGYAERIQKEFFKSSFYNSNKENIEFKLLEANKEN